ncbi:MAG: hypothetical protein EOL87_00830 [Spartobacteria bacterium]|nr:hypothetical protein [Spartobacteria bacterium]
MVRCSGRYVMIWNTRNFFGRICGIVLLALCVCPGMLFGEAMLQYFNTSWSEITEKMPELAEAGYTSLWVPPPTKASGGLSVGYDLWDPLDLGGRDQRSTVKTRYGTEAQLLRLLEVAHRFGIRVYFDNIMNHRAFDIPGYNESTAIDIYPGMVPEDFHLKKTEEGFYRKWDNCRNWQDAWQVQNLGLSDLIDIAHETPNDNFGTNEGDDHPKWVGVRHPDNPEFYLDLDLPIRVGYEADGQKYEWDEYTFANKEPYEDVGYTNSLGVLVGAGNGSFDWADSNGNGQHDMGELSEPFEDTGLEPSRSSWCTEEYGYGDGVYNMGNPISEDVGAYLIRAVRWLVDRTKCDGLRLDAVKHVPDYFFGEFGSDTSGAGYTGAAQVQYNLSHGISDWENHRNSVFNTEIPRDDAMMFGEHLGSPPSVDGYFSAGMRLVDNDLRSKFNGILGNQWSGMTGMDAAGSGGYAPALGVMHAQSHDNDYAACKEIQHAFYFTREGLGLLYTDGNHHAETLGDSGGAFPRWANTAFLGQWGDNKVPNLLYAHNQFARGYQRGVYSDDDYCAYERLDWRQGGYSDADKVTMLIMINDNYSNCQSRSIDQNTSFPHVAGGYDAYLYNYSEFGGGFYKYASQLWDVCVPQGGYFIFSWKNPDGSQLWSQTGGKELTIYEDGHEAGWMPYVRSDGPDGDPGFNPYGVFDSDPADYSYTYWVPRVTKGTNLQFIARVDGSAGNVLMKLDGGVDLNGTAPEDYSWDQAHRDNPPTKADDVLLGYEYASFVKRIHREKFAAKDVAHNKIGSAGATSYEATIGTAGITIAESDAANDYDVTETAAFIWHDPESDAGQFSPVPADAAGADITLWTQTGNKNNINKVFVYYTTDGTSWPEGAGGSGKGHTQVAELTWDHEDTGDAQKDWWRGTIPAQPAGATLRYKLGCFRQQDGSEFAPWGEIWPGGSSEVAMKTTRMGVWEIADFNGETVDYYPHNDFSEMVTGLAEGFHFIQARAFLKRDNAAAIYNTFKQTFYYDVQTPGGKILWPQKDHDSIGGQQYGAVVLSDETARELYIHIDDSDPANDDYITEVMNGNGRGFEPYEDLDDSGEYEEGEPFTDINGNGVRDALLDESWQTAYEDSSFLPGADGLARKWQFNYVNIPSGGSNCVIKARVCEWSSSDRSAWTPEMTDEQGHFTTLLRQVYTWGPDQRLMVAWPQKDGDEVGAGYGMKAYFSKSLAEGLDEEGLIDRLTIRIQSTVSGIASNGTIQDKSGYKIVWNESDDYHALLYTLPNLYNGQPDWLHGIEVTLDREGMGDLVATRLVKARKAEEAPNLEIVEPKEYDSDGRKINLVIADVANPAAKDRSMQIRLRTTTNVVTQSISMDSWPAGYTGTVQFVTNLIDTGVQFIDYEWSGMMPGYFHFTAKVQTETGASNSAGRNCYVNLREMVTASTNSLDDDDDGILDLDEVTSMALTNAVSSPNSDLWVQREIFTYYSYGKTSATSPDTDGDGLSDGLELGWRVPSLAGQTDTETDTNGDGFKNFLADLDPPFYNTLDNYGNVPSVDSISKGGDRTKKLYGTTTDATNADTDYDGIPDGIEDANRNGWVDGDGEAIPVDWNPWLTRNWPDGEVDPGEIWTETDPNNSDSDADGINDGYGEDKNFNGVIDGDTNGDRVWQEGEQWTETDPINPDSDGDGLPDGWEAGNNLDPLDSGTVSLRGGTPDLVNGSTADPDDDGFDNGQEYANGTNPWVADTGIPPPPGSIEIGRGLALGVINGVTNYVEFTDWQESDLIALDNYNTEAQNSAVDIYRAWDGYDTSRDMVAFYIHDGGDPASGGDGQFYFRVDFHDLQANAEDGYLNVYVVVDMNSPGAGERNLPDEIDTGTDMRWEAVVAVYGYNDGRVYVDLDRQNNTTAIAQNLSDYGVVGRDQTSADGFKQAHFNAELDAVEFSISRQALLDAGWNGLDYRQLNFQAYTTKDGTSNDPVGSGDIGGRSDVRDAIRNAFICSDYWRDQDWIINNGYLTQWVGHSADNDIGKCTKIAMLMHGNQHIQPGSVMQHLINNGEGAGLQRSLNIHDVYQRKLNLHITPTFASALQWAKTDPDTTETWRMSRFADGPAFNNWIRDLVSTGTVHLLATTFSDHILPYFNYAFNNDNEALAEEYLSRIYGAEFDENTVFWTPERVLDEDVFTKIKSMGFHSTIIDQNSHMWYWFGRSTALSDDGYRINRVNDVSCFVINNNVDQYKYTIYDGGIAMALRGLFNRRARSGTQDQVVTMFYAWEDAVDNEKAASYDSVVRWLANRPWVRMVALDDVLAGKEDLDGDGNGDVWWQLDRETAKRQKLGHDWLNHATQMNYDNWYVGSATEEGLQRKKFDIRSGVSVSKYYGMMFYDGMISNAWSKVESISNTNVSRLARSVIHASVFETAFHTEDNNNLEKFSTGEYIYPATGEGNLIDFAKIAQSQTRNAALYAKVDAWASAAASLTNTVRERADVDIDGEDEFLLYNKHVCALFERSGGRMVAAWVRRVDGEVYQVVGNPVNYAGSETEDEGTYNANSNGLGSYRTSCLKDWWAGTTDYVNVLYAITESGDTGWQLTSADGKISKTVTLDHDANVFEVVYQVGGDLAGQNIYVRNGLSPRLMNLLMSGQTYLTRSAVDNGVLHISNRDGFIDVTAGIGVSDAAHTAQINTAAVDDNPDDDIEFYTLNMRNLAQIEQVEVFGADNFTFSLVFSAQAQSGADSDQDGIPDSWELDHFGDLSSVTSNSDFDVDGFLDRSEYVAGTDPKDPADLLEISSSAAAASASGGIIIRFQSKTNRSYYISYGDAALSTGSWTRIDAAITGTGSEVQWVDTGDETVPAPAETQRRMYRLEVDAPQE